MTQAEIIGSFTQEQLQEFNDDIKTMILDAGKSYDFDSQKVAEINTNMRLKGDIYLNVSVLFHADNNKNITGEVISLKKFDTVDGYLDSINNSKKLSDDGFKSLK